MVSRLRRALFAPITPLAVFLVTGGVYAAPIQQTGGVTYDTINAIIAVGGLGIGVLAIVAFIVSRLPNSKGSNDAVSELASALKEDAKSRTEQTKLDREIHEQRKKELETISAASTKLQAAVDATNDKWIELSTRQLKLMDDGISTSRALRDSVNDGNRDHETRAAAFRTETLGRLDALAEKVTELSKEVLGAENKPSIKSILTTISEEITGLRADLSRIPPAVEAAADKPVETINLKADTVNIQQTEPKGTPDETPNPDPTPKPATPEPVDPSAGANAGADPRADAGDGAK